MDDGGTSVVLQGRAGKLGALGSYGELASGKDMNLEDCHWADSDAAKIEAAGSGPRLNGVAPDIGSPVLLQVPCHANAYDP